MSRIDDELSGRFDRATRPVDSPSLGKLERRRRSHLRRIRFAGVGLSILVIAATVSVFIVARSGFGADPVASPAPPQFDLTAYGTYVFSDLGLKPSPPDPQTGRTDPQLLLVAWKAAWSGDQYPGVHDCHFSVQDGQGREMGTARAEISIASPASEDPNQIEVKIDGDPEQAQTAQAWCDDARDDTPIAYDISNEHVIGNFKWRPDSDPGVVIGFDVRWPVELPDYPSENWCTAELFRASGESVASLVFTLSVPQGPMEQRVWASDFSDPFAVDEAATLRADVTCAPITGNEEVPFDRKKEVVSVDMEALLDLTWDEYWERLPSRMHQWSERIQLAEMDPDQIAGAMDSLTHLVNERPDDAHTFWINEVMQRRQYLCERLPADHEYRNGEYCD